MERETGVPVDEQGYVNSGVMLMNLPVWRRDRLAVTGMAFVKQHQPLFPDQTGINIACSGKIVSLSEEWNFQLHKPRHANQWLEPRIIHYSSGRKPWLYGDVPFAPIYLYHRNQTPFPIKPPPAQRGKVRRALNLLIGRRKYWDQLIIARRCRAFAIVYFDKHFS
jgi:hypothetical protein